MRAKLIFVLAAATLAACSDSNGPDTSSDALDPNAVSVPGEPAATPRGGGDGGSDGGPAVPSSGVTPPCLEHIRLASDLLPGPSTCRR
jgi:hypothetical protein